MLIKASAETIQACEQVFLTNALTGWEPPQEPKRKLPFPGLEEERDAAERVKRERPILVILGNPPYDGFAGVAINEERALTNAYRSAKPVPPPEGQGLNNLFVRFFRMAERRIVEKTGEGIVCFISPYTWLDGRSFTGMRERYLEAFDRIWIDSLNGDKFKTGKLTPDGHPDPSIFSTDLNREGIQVGTSIALLVRKEDHASTKSVLFRNFWGKEKQSDLLASIENQSAYEEIEPVDYLGLPFTPIQSKGEYEHWSALPDLFPASFPGVKTSRDDVVVDTNQDQLVSRMKKYFDPDVSNDQMRRIAPNAMEDAARFDAMKVREHLLKRGFLPENIVPYVYRPFDLRWLYWEPETKLLDEKRAEYFPQIFEGNIWIGAVSQNRKEFNPPLVASRLCSLHVIERGANLFPLWLCPRERRETLDFEPSVDQSEAEKPRLNLSSRAIEYLSAIGTLNDGEALFYHVIAVLHAPAYACEHSGALRQNWPRIPLPVEREALLASAAIGRQIAELLNTETEIHGITVGRPRQELCLTAKIRRLDSGTLGQDTTDLQVNASWGYRNQNGAVMPGRGRVENRNYTLEEQAAMELETNNSTEAFTLLGNTTYDVYLNENVIWQNVPSAVWHYTIGGYQVIKKWLSFREHKVLGRALSLDELQEIAKIARRITALLLLRPKLDANHLKIKSSSAIYMEATPRSGSETNVK